MPIGLGYASYAPLHGEASMEVQTMRKLIAGNWKMNGLTPALDEIGAIVEGLGGASDHADILICPPATLVAAAVVNASGSSLSIGGQTCHSTESGAHTGDISAAMLKNAGANYVIVGHSERRADHGETDETVAAQTVAALSAGLTPIICCGESLEQREAGETSEVILSQLAVSIPDAVAGKPFVVAYEPIWAIGTGLTANTDQIGEVHDAIREALKERFGTQADTTPILYGGSMKPGNAAEILSVANVDGGLIGGASLKAADFLAIYAAAK